MKKTIILSFIILCTSVVNLSFGTDTGDGSATTVSGRITSLVINANVTVVLVNNDKAEIEITGRNILTGLITFKKTGDTLVIGSLRQKDLKEAGIIYIPASQLRNIRINSSADVRSLYALQVPLLNVVVNGDCSFSVSNIGRLNVTGTDKYSVEHTTEMRPLPASILPGKE